MFLKGKNLSSFPKLRTWDMFALFVPRYQRDMLSQGMSLDVHPAGAQGYKHFSFLG